MPIAADPPPPPWRSPVAPMAIVRRYREVPRFEAGGHRGVDLRASPGGEVVAPCGGRVSFRGAVAGGPPTLTIDCGRLRATLQRVAPSVGVGAGVERGARVGTATDAAVDLSARRVDGSYLDPARLLGEAGARYVPVVVARPARPAPRRPALTAQHAYRLARIADRALVTPNGAPASVAAPREQQQRVDRPLGLAAGALMGAVAVAWGAGLARRRWHTPKAARGAGLARVQR